MALGSSSAEGARSLGHGLYIIPLPLPFPGLRGVNSYLFEEDSGLTLLDCGIASDEGHHALTTGMHALGFDPADVSTLVVTHLHVDHVGLAPRLLDELGCKLVMHATASAMVDRYNDTARFFQRTGELARRHGATPEEVAEMASPEPRPGWMPFAVPPDITVVDGDRVPIGGGRHLEVLHTPGHDVSHICLIDSLTGAVFSGDHLLPGITPFVPYEEGGDTLADYLAGLARLEQLGIGLTYPAHGRIIDRGAVRAAQIRVHHRRRLDDMVTVLAAGPATAWQVMQRIFRPNLVAFEQRLALRETLAHLEHLLRAGRLSSFEEDGVVWYRRFPALFT